MPNEHRESAKGSIKPTSLDELIARKAEEFADQVRAAAALADKEEEIRIEVERQLAFIEREAGVKLEGRHEFTIAKGRADSVYNRVIIEYKNPSSPASRIGPGANSPGTQKVVEQIKQRFYDLRPKSKDTINTLFGVGCDGKHFVFVRFYDDKWQIQDPVEVNKHSTERFLWALFNLGESGRRFDPEHLAGDFGSTEGSVATTGIPVLYAAISATTNPKAQTFFNQWKILFGEVCGYDVDNPSEKIKKLADFYGVPGKGVKPAEMLFAVHTYYALFMKLLAGEIISHFHRLPSQIGRIVGATTSTKLKDALADLEAGGIFRHLGITNFLEGDLFAWYLPAWSDEIESVIRKMASKLDAYNPGTLAEEPGESRDMLKKLYQQLFPKSVRHDLGEYYTPDWLAEHVLNELGYAGDPDKRLLDPACGSGTFLVMAIIRIRSWYEKNREQLRYDEGELCKKILANVVGFDLNPLAVMAARTNYLIAIRDLVSHVDKVEIPVYLCDSILTPSEYADLFLGSYGAAKVPCSACRPPHLLVPKEVATDANRVATYAHVIEHSILVERSEEEFVALCEDEGIPIGEPKLHQELYRDLLRLHKESRNGVWARIIKNAFAPLFAGRFDVVAGNPPWINWEHLPPDYRTQTEHIWKNYRLMGPIPVRKRQSSDASKTDISILMTYVAADKYLSKAGKLGFVITRSVFQSELGGWHFRAFRLPDGQKLRMLGVDDLDRLKPFEGQAANVTSTFAFALGQETKYPVPWRVYRAKDGSQFGEDADYSEIVAGAEVLNWTARPINADQIQSAWIFGDEHVVDIIMKLMQPSFYAPRAREGVNTRGSNGVYFVDAERVQGKLMITNRPQDGDDSTLPQHRQTIEPQYLFPLLRGRDVGRWRALPSGYIVLPHDPDDPNDPITFGNLPPKTQEFLTTFKAKLKGRRKFRNFDPSGPKWHGLYSVLDATFSPHKVVWREMATGSVAAVVASAPLPNNEEKVVIPDHKLFIIPCASEQESHFVCGMFNCAVSNYLIRSYAISTGISTHVLDRIPIPRFDRSNSVHVSLARAARQCATAAARESDLSNAEESLNETAADVLKVSRRDRNSIFAALEVL